MPFTHHPDAPFADRRDAGRRLAPLLARHRDERPLVLGLPRGGVPVAFEVARALGAPLDVMVARKIGAPQNPEFGVGAIAPGGVRVLDEDVVRALDIAHEEIDQIVADETLEMERRLMLYRGDARAPDVRGRFVVLVDDGLATGVTARAAVRALRAMEPRRLVLAVPVAAPETAEALAREVDELVVVETPPDFRAVGLWYRVFDQTSDDEVLRLLDEARSLTGPASGGPAGPVSRGVRVPADDVELEGDLAVPAGAVGVVLFAHGSGSSRFSPRNRAVAESLRARGLGTLLIDLLTREEEAVDERTRELRFDIGLLARRLEAVAVWLSADPDTARLPIGLFGSSTGGGAALVAAAARPDLVRAVVSRGGRPDLAAEALAAVRAPTLLVVGGRDDVVLELNEDAERQLRLADTRLHVVPGATHLFEEPGALDEVARVAGEWFVERLRAARAPDTERRAAL